MASRHHLIPEAFLVTRARGAESRSQHVNFVSILDLVLNKATFISPLYIYVLKERNWYHYYNIRSTIIMQCSRQSGDPSAEASNIHLSRPEERPMPSRSFILPGPPLFRNAHRNEFMRGTNGFGEMHTHPLIPP